MEVPEFLPIVGMGHTATSPPSDDEHKRIIPRWKGSGNIMSKIPSSSSPLTSTSKSLLNNIKSSSSSVTNINNMKPSSQQSIAAFIQSSSTALMESYVKLGPGQIHPKGYRLTSGRYGELKLSLFKIKGTLELEVISARNIVPVDCESPPDTYVKCYLKDGDRLRHKKKTRVIRHSAEPIYKQTLKYQISDVFGRNLVIMVWQRGIGFEHNQGLGGAELSIDKLNIRDECIGGWYPLFPMHSFGGSDSNDSP